MSDDVSNRVVNENFQSQPEVQDKKQKSTGKKWLIGCSIGCLAMIILSVLFCGVGGYFGYKYVHNKVDQWSQEFEDKGFAKITGHVIELADDVNESTLYIGQVVKIFGNCQGDVAVIAQVCQIHGNVEGTVYFRGQMLEIEPKATIQGDIDVLAQSVVIYGKVNGQINGKYQILDDKTGTQKPGCRNRQ
ncbi:MAG: polymer-forming cytoskeletal protein [Anaerohalosphaeraceae bacterium]|nr:polymer-forming cytoskeletal protein [Anaerohalosphaeraceae bacterium]